MLILTTTKKKQVVQFNLWFNPFNMNFSRGCGKKFKIKNKLSISYLNTHLLGRWLSVIAPNSQFKSGAMLYKRAKIKSYEAQKFITFIYLPTSENFKCLFLLPITANKLCGKLLRN